MTGPAAASVVKTPLSRLSWPAPSTSVAGRLVELGEAAIFGQVLHDQLETADVAHAADRGRMDGITLASPIFDIGPLSRCTMPATDWCFSAAGPTA